MQSIIVRFARHVWHELALPLLPRSRAARVRPLPLRYPPLQTRLDPLAQQLAAAFPLVAPAAAPTVGVHAEGAEL